MGPTEGMGPLGIPIHSLEDNIKIDIREIGCGDMEYIHFALIRDQRRTLVNKVISLLAL